MVKPKEDEQMAIKQFISYGLFIAAMILFTQLPGIRNILDLIGSTDNGLLRTSLFIGVYAGFMLCFVGLIIGASKLKKIIQK